MKKYVKADFEDACIVLDLEPFTAQEDMANYPNLSFEKISQFEPDSAEYEICGSYEDIVKYLEDNGLSHYKSDIECSTKLTSSKYVGAGKSFSGYISEKIRDEIYNAVADVLMQYPDISVSDQRRYTKKAFDWFMDKYFMYDFDDMNG